VLHCWLQISVFTFEFSKIRGESRTKIWEIAAQNMRGCWRYNRRPENEHEEWVGQMTRKRKDNIKMGLIFLYHDDVRRNCSLESCNITSRRWFHQMKCLLYLTTVTDSAASQACYFSSFTGWAPWCGRRNWNHQSVLQQRCISVSLIFVCLSICICLPTRKQASRCFTYLENILSLHSEIKNMLNGILCLVDRASSW